MCLSEEQESRLTYLGIYSTSHKHPLCPHHIHRACTYPLAHKHAYLHSDIHTSPLVYVPLQDSV